MDQIPEFPRGLPVDEAVSPPLWEPQKFDVPASNSRYQSDTYEIRIPLRGAKVYRLLRRPLTIGQLRIPVGTIVEDMVDTCHRARYLATKACWTFEVGTTDAALFWIQATKNGWEEIDVASAE